MTDEDITVIETTLPAPTPEPAVVTLPVAQPKLPSMALNSLSAKRNALQENLHIDLQVPRWTEPEIFVRYGPVDVTILEKQRETREASKLRDWNILLNADILAFSCIGVYACLDGDYDTKYSLRKGDENGTWTKFDADLAANLGAVTTAAADVVRAVYMTDGDMLEAAQELTLWSAKKNKQVDEGF